MLRRHLLCSALASAALVSPVLAQTSAPTAAPAPAATATPLRIPVPLELLQTEVAKRFPVRYPVAGLVDLDLGAPRLGVLPTLNRLRAEMPIKAAGPALNQVQSGSFTLPLF